MPVSRPFIPFALPDIGEEEIEEVVDSLRSGWITTGVKSKRFEDDFAEYIGSDIRAVSVNSATAGMHLVLEALGIGHDDTVITTPYTFTATAEVVRYLGADPVFADIDSGSFNIDPSSLEEKLREYPDAKCVIPVHIAGQSCDMDAIGYIAQKAGIEVMEDAAHALPATYKGRNIGTISKATVFSFYATKPITTGEGGMIVSEDPALIDRVRTMRLHGISKDVFDRYVAKKPSWYYEVIAPGYKYNMSDISAAIGIHQLRKAEAFLNRRSEIARRYNDGLQDLPLIVPKVVRPEDIHSWHLYIIQLELGRLDINRDKVIELLSEQGVGTSVHFIPLHLHPYWRDRYRFVPESFPNALSVYQCSVSLPIYTRMSDEEVERVIEAVRDILLSHLR